MSRPRQQDLGEEFLYVFEPDEDNEDHHDQSERWNQAGFLVHSERDRPCRSPQPRYAHLDADPGQVT